MGAEAPCSGHAVRKTGSQSHETMRCWHRPSGYQGGRSVIPGCHRARRLGRALSVFVLAGAAGLATATPSSSSVLPSLIEMDSIRAAKDSGAARTLDSLFGHSGKLRVKLVANPRDLGLTRIARLFGLDDAPKPGIYEAKDSAVSRPFSLIALLPFTAKSAGKVGTYRVGSWPSESRPARSAAYSN